MPGSARNQFEGTVKSIKRGNSVAEVVLAVNGREVVAAIPRSTVASLGRRVGDEAPAVIKAAEVMIAQ